MRPNANILVFIDLRAKKIECSKSVRITRDVDKHNLVRTRPFEIASHVSLNLSGHKDRCEASTHSHSVKFRPSSSAVVQVAPPRRSGHVKTEPNF